MARRSLGVVLGVPIRQSGSVEERQSGNSRRGSERRQEIPAADDPCKPQTRGERSRRTVASHEEKRRADLEAAGPISSAMESLVAGTQRKARQQPANKQYPSAAETSQLLQAKLDAVKDIIQSSQENCWVVQEVANMAKDFENKLESRNSGGASRKALKCSEPSEPVKTVESEDAKRRRETLNESSIADHKRSRQDLNVSQVHAMITKATAPAEKCESKTRRTRQQRRVKASCSDSAAPGVPDAPGVPAAAAPAAAPTAAPVAPAATVPHHPRPITEINIDTAQERGLSDNLDIAASPVAQSSSFESEKIVVDTSNLLGIHRFANERVMETDRGSRHYMIYHQQHTQADPRYLSIQPYLNREMRATLFDWMFEVGEHFCLLRDTLHTALNLVDRYFSRVPRVPKNQLQLVGVTALWIASKTKELYPPAATYFAFATDRAYQPGDLVNMERSMLRALDWLVDPVTCNMWSDLYYHKLFPGTNTQRVPLRLVPPMNAGATHESDDASSTSTVESSPREALVTLRASGRAGRAARGNNARYTNQDEIAPRSWMTPRTQVRGVSERIMEIIDLSLLDINALHFLPSAIAAAVTMHVLVDEMGLCSIAQVEEVTQYSKVELSACLSWLHYAFLLPKTVTSHPSTIKIVRYYDPDDLHCFQRHHTGALALFNMAGPKYDISEGDRSVVETSLIEGSPPSVQHLRRTAQGRAVQNSPSALGADEFIDLQSRERL